MSQPYYPPPAPPQPQAPAVQRPKKLVVPAWLAFSFGIAGVVGIPIPILNNLTALLAVVGAICGIVGLFGSKKWLAGLSLALCLAGVAGTVAIQAAWSHRLDQIQRDINTDSSCANPLDCP